MRIGGDNCAKAVTPTVYTCTGGALWEEKEGNRSGTASAKCFMIVSSLPAAASA